MTWETTAPDQAVILEIMEGLGTAVLEAKFEADFLLDAARIVFDHITCDVVNIIRVRDQVARTRAEVTAMGARSLAPDEVEESFTEDDARQWLLMLETAFVPDMQTTSLMKPKFKEYAQKIGIRTGLIVPLVLRGELLGFVSIGWKMPRTPERLDRKYIRQLLDIVAKHVAFVNTRMRQHYDPLTGLYNRRALEQHWPAANAPVRGVLLYMDLDGFKALNDARGHAAGDEYLRRAADELRDSTPPGGATYRLGGDEFVLLAPGVARGDVDRLVDRIAQRFAKLASSLPPPRPGITIGVAYAPDDGNDLAELLGKADKSMYERKRQRAVATIVATVDSRFDVRTGLRTGGKDLSKGEDLARNKDRAERTEWANGQPSVDGYAAHSATGAADGHASHDTTLAADGQASYDATGAAKVSPHAPRAADPLAMSDEMFHGWIEMWPDGFFVTDPDFKIIFVNKGFEHMTGYSLSGWLGKSPAFVASGEIAPRSYRAMWDGLHESGSWTGQVVNRRPDGVEWVALMSVARLMTPGGTHVGYMGNARDVSHSLWAGRPDAETSAQEAFTQEALAFALAESGQLHEGGSRQHLERIRDFTRLLVLGAADAGYQELQRYETRNTIVLASILHDIGKLAIPEGLLRKPGRLSKEEFELMKTHTSAGEQLLRSPYFDQDTAAPRSEFLTISATIARSHHEWWDGSGYPDGLAGEEIPLGARIVGIADVYDALRSQRPYKNPWSHREAVEYIVGGAGKQFDPTLVKIFVDRALKFKAGSERALDEIRARVHPSQDKTG